MSDDLRIGILIVAYNAASTLRQVLDRIPEGFRSRVEKVYVCDDFSTDDTYLIGLGYSQSRDDLPITMVRQPRNLGYGGNQKSGYRMAIDDGMDVVVLLHGDGQYAPEKLPDMVAPFETASADAVFGSRMMTRGAALKGGMPKYKYVGNKILSRFENSMLGTNLSEFHSGYRAYSTKALASIDFESNSDDFDFDTEIIIQLVEAGLRIKEIPIPTYYGDEICRVNGMRYAADVATDVVTWRLNKMGFGQGRFADVGVEYDLKPAPDSSHGVMLRWLDSMPASKVLDLGCSGGHFAEAARAGEHRVTGVDVATAPGVEDRVDRFIQSDLDSGMDQSWLAEVGEERFDVVVLGDVLEHVRQPGRLLADARGVLVPGGSMLISVPNFGHWYPRIRTAVGAFDYDMRGILDRTHVRFFTRRSFTRMLADAKLRVVRFDQVGLPLNVLAERADGEAPTAASPGMLARAEGAMTQAWPTMFAYQFVVKVEPT
ncbi:MAG: bifunctional glycosyltransferase/class I SAM-dependent methyltransferase [Candidatus Microthrix parvicella]